ncbi:hypothetical protein BDQ12DRAFT_717792 [Crucibulum laeve]|uniref:Proteophosphoglycan ppg4 n=1 Tax=Crucibulum laeve TaxID=68775 RepID=A0A5C3MJT4_9AGAR|nr:hypothetical protein BDQ12DRAFT_717792 [Crucibulum laeve]
MSISMGGLGIISLRNPFAELVGLLLGKGDLRSMFCVVVFFIVSLVLAYLTNPSENSFRAYLTEQSFRQHLSRLDDSPDDDNIALDSIASRKSSRPTLHSRSFDHASSPCHFANRASISLRTPKHVFHSFAVFTIAAMVPVSKTAQNDDRDGWMISDSWYIGAFGRWWRGGVLETWYQDVITRHKDEESWSSGILSMKSLDMLQDYTGPTFSAKHLPPHLFNRGSPPKLRNRERSAQRHNILPARSSTPPPLPKTASLPLHATRIPASSADRPCTHPSQSSLLQPSHALDPIRIGPSTPSRTSSALFDQSPLIAEVLRQISTSKASVLELRTQLTDCQAAASQSHTLLQEEVDSFREKKRQEDGFKAELKSRTKTLDDSKRAAEGQRREVEKKLKAAQSARDGANQRMTNLGKEIIQLQQCIHDDDAFVKESRNTVSETEQEIVYSLERKRHEIKVAEDVVIALSQRSKELEEKIAQQKERLKALKEMPDAQKQDHVFPSSNGHVPSDSWPLAPQSSSNPPTGDRQRHESLPGMGTRQELQSPVMSRPGNLALGSISNFTNSTSMAIPNGNHILSLFHGANQYSTYGDTARAFKHTSPHFSNAHSSFTDPEASLLENMPSILSPTTQSLIPSGLITSMDNGDGLSRSFQSESDAFMEKDWRGNVPGYPYVQHSDGFSPGYNAVNDSPTSIHGSSTNDTEHDPFEVRAPLHDHRWDQLPSEQSMDTQRAMWMHHANSEPKLSGYETEEANTAGLGLTKSGPRRWFSTKEKPKKGLNPDAKEFSLSRKSPPSTMPGHSATASFDALNPNGLGSTVMSAASTNNLLLRAFAPSPAEREALQRALGGSTNTSFERLPSLSDVSSIPSSPSSAHALPVVPHAPEHPACEFNKVLPSWLQSFPRIRKVNFSPWDDEEPVSTNNSSVEDLGIQRRG